MEYFMRRTIQLSVACLAAGVVSACSGRDAVTDTGVAPTGGVRFINAIPDTAGSAGLDFRFVDLVENNAHYAIPFRNTISTSGGIPASTQIQFKATAAGDRHYRIFLDDSLPSVAQTRLGCPTVFAATDRCIGDSTMKVEADHRYTALLWGNARGGANPMKLTIIDETCDPGNQIGLRVINAGFTAIDVRVYQNVAVASGGTTTNTGTAPATPTWANVPPMSVSTCINFPPTAPTTTASGKTTTTTYRFNVQPAGGGTALFTDAAALIGVANGQQANGCLVGTDCDATPGTSAAGSALTGVVFPRSVAGSKAAQFSTPAISFMWDKRPLRNDGT
jgi:hypothetical protein